MFKKVCRRKKWLNCVLNGETSNTKDKNLKLRRKVSHYQIMQNDRLANFHHFSPVNKIFHSFFIFRKFIWKNQTRHNNVSETFIKRKFVFVIPCRRFNSIFLQSSSQSQLWSKSFTFSRSIHVFAWNYKWRKENMLKS